MSYARQNEVLSVPNLIEIQKKSYQWFLDEGLREVFNDISPIADFSGHLSLEFVDYMQRTPRPSKLRFVLSTMRRRTLRKPRSSWGICL